MFGLFLFAKIIHNQTEKDAQKDAGCQRKVKRDTAAPAPDIPRETAQMDVRKKVRVVQQQTAHEQNNSGTN
jgi:hypothetical protein